MYSNLALAQSTTAVPFKSILDYIVNHGTSKSMFNKVVADTNTIQFNIIDTVNSPRNILVMYLITDYLTHKYSKPVREWDADSIILHFADSVQESSKPFYSNELRQISVSSSPINCSFVQFEPAYIGISFTASLKEPPEGYRLSDPEFYITVLIHINSLNEIEIVVEHMNFVFGRN